MQKIVTVVGARPQFIKAAAVSRVLKSAEGVNEILVHTGQHYNSNMSDIFFEELEIPRPDYNLGIGSCTHDPQTGKMLQAIEKVLMEEKPDWVLVYGDTNSTLAGALAAVKLHIPVAHVEAGVRNFDRSIIPDDLLFCPTITAVENLSKEGLSAFAHLTGDVMLDLFLEWERKIESLAESIIKELNLNAGEYLLVTLHRPLNVDDISRLKSILTALHESGRQIVFPIHPRTHKNITESELGEIMDSWLNFRQLPPLSYATFLALAKCAYGIVTDSGGVQKEAYFLGTPCTTIFPFKISDLLIKLIDTPELLHKAKIKGLEVFKDNFSEDVISNKFNDWIMANLGKSQEAYFSFENVSLNKKEKVKKMLLKLFRIRTYRLFLRTYSLIIYLSIKCKGEIMAKRAYFIKISDCGH